MAKHIGKEVKRFNCNFCEKSYGTSYTLNRHVRSHTGERPFQCEQCEKSFTDMSYLRPHIMKVHNKISEKRDVKLKCDICDKYFSSRMTLKTHNLLHIGEKTFDCELCDKTFETKSNLNDHVTNIHEYKPFKCAINKTDNGPRRDMSANDVPSNRFQSE